MVAWINYDYHVVYVRFIGTYRQYDKIDVQNI
ncbi:MAG TPA: type II toxin-antitoxin system HigB family toxin [Rhodanobacter sp.]|nr:type II toxin-antitoxin system HigB family toxin [Rhodanobacter sp.]